MQHDEIIELAKSTIAMEAETLRLLEQSVSDAFVQVVQLLSEMKGRLIVTGVGKSAIIGQKIVATLNSTGSSAIFLHAADAIHGDLGMVLTDDMVLAMSKSGETAELKSLIPHILRKGNKIIAMTAKADSFLAKQSHYVLLTPVEKEADPNNLAPTSSSIAQLALGDALAVCLLSLRNFDHQDFADLHPGGSLGKSLTWTVDHLLHQQSWPQVQADTQIKEVIYNISSHRLGATVVVAQQKVLGIITDGDLRRMLEKYDDALKRTAAEVMTPDPKSIVITAKANEAATLIKNLQINHLVVLDEHEDYAGLIHIQDLLREGLL